MIDFEFVKVSTMKGDGAVINDCYRIIPGEDLEMTDLTLEDLIQFRFYLSKFIQRELELEGHGKGTAGEG